LIAICVAVPAVPVAVNVTGLPLSEPDVAVSVLVPAAGPRVQLPTVAMPFASVVWVPPVTLPPPVVTAKVTATPATGLFDASFTTTDGGGLTAVPTCADCVVGLFAAMLAADPAAKLIVPDVAAVSPLAPKLSV
jgi:hypothetical protein